MKKFILFFTFVLGCGGSDSVNIDIDLAVNQNGNPLLEVASAVQAQTSAGIYFVLEELNCPPVSISDLKTGVAPLAQPSIQDVGSSPISKSYSINTSTLQKNAYYRISMLALPVSKDIRTPTHQGVGDCPIKISDGGNNQTTICFGDAGGDTPICPGTVPSSQCAAFTQPSCS